MVTAPSAMAATSSGTPLPSLPKMSATGRGQVHQVGGFGFVHGGRPDFYACFAQVHAAIVGADGEQRHAEDAAGGSPNGFGIPGADRFRAGRERRRRRRPQRSAGWCPRLPGSCTPASTTIRGTTLRCRSSRWAQVQSGGSTRAATGCGVWVARMEASRSPGHAAGYRFRAAEAMSSAAFQNPAPRRRRRTRKPARRASVMRFGPSIPARDGLRGWSRGREPASARRNSFTRAFCLLCTMRTGIGAQLSGAVPILRRFALRRCIAALLSCTTDWCYDSFRLYGIFNLGTEVGLLVGGDIARSSR